ncbi:actin binding Rho activating protein b isoform X1 [Periophthalmus magnuspinnatus]|uniref:actin binding Rho activating protein b isoform X1 n=1 Tax=Periophthalmus magnuspinnatus TaxID=409849 RepID=UPI002436EB64|nr:actin binding Rho activating protein b isoform X1 [Periophthalmus magnuspinnatus]
MADGKAKPQKKTYTNKNIKKLRAVSMVCSLTSSWQQWVTDNETKQASEPSGWAPSWLGDPNKEPKKTWTPKKIAQEDVKKQDNDLDNGIPAEKLLNTSKTEDEANIAELVVASPIKTKQVEKTITSVAKEKSIGIGVLTEKITKESLPSNEEIDKLLKKKSSPTRRRKCSNMVSSLTKSWKQVEGTVTDGTGAKDGEILNVEVDGEQAKADVKGKERIEEVNEVKQNEKEEEEESAVKIKRPSVTLSLKKESEDAHKINALSKRYSAVGSLKSRWQNWASEHTVNQKLNPFSEYFDYDYSMSTRLQKGQEGYGRPKEGTKTAERAKRAEQHIHREIDDMCMIIRTMADRDPDGKTRVTFGELFDRYVRISDKVVGILMRARKHGKVAFEGEMLWQGRDDGVVITLLV